MPTEFYTSPHRAGDIAAVDQLIRDALAYNTPKQLKALFEFSRRLPHYAPFNCLLLHIQRPSATFVAPLQKWAKLGCKLKANAQPLLILAPMHPVMFVFDVADVDPATLTPAVRRAIEPPFSAAGLIPKSTWENLLRQCQKAGITCEFANLAPERAGSIARGDGPMLRMKINRDHDHTVQFTTIAHELGHLFCGHLGKESGEWWPDNRMKLELSTQELEAEAAAMLACQRFGVIPAAAAYLAGHLEFDQPLPPFSLEAVLVAAGAIHEMASGRPPSRMRTAKKRQQNS